MNLFLIEEIKIFEDDPVSCNKIIWIITKTNKIKGIKKCKVKNKDKVGALILKFPHIQITKLGSITLKRFVITVPPQRDICPQGRTYPIKAAAISKI